jgi:LPS export ABC transporter protein LptC
MSPRRIARLLALVGTLALAIIMVVTVVVVRRRSAEENLKSLAAIVPGTILHAHNFNWTQMRGNRREWVLKASDASYSNDRTSILLFKPQLSMTAQNGKKFSLSALHAVLTVSGNHIEKAEMSGNLEADYGDFVVITDAATFLPDSDQLTAPGSVRIKGPGLDIAGRGLAGHPKAQTFQLLKEVKTIVQQQKQHPGISQES